MPQYLFLTSRRPDLIRQLPPLYALAGWHRPGDTCAFYRRLVDGSLQFAVAVQEGEVVGMARAIGDGVSDAYIQDVFVKPAFRRNGIAGALVCKLSARLKRDGLGWIGLVARGASGALYRKCGFRALRGHAPMLLSK